MIICKEYLQPGDMVSLDQYQTPGRLPNIAKKEHMNNHFHGGTLMIDHATGFIQCNNQVSLNMGETLEGIFEFEQLGSQYGVKVKKWQCENCHMPSTLIDPGVVQGRFNLALNKEKGSQ